MKTISSEKIERILLKRKNKQDKRNARTEREKHKKPRGPEKKKPSEIDKLIETFHTW